MTQDAQPKEEMKQKVLLTIEEMRQEIIQLAVDMVRIPSVNPEC